MKRRFRFELAGALLAAIGSCAPAAADPDAAKLFADHCAACHGADRLGGQGPALLPENLGRLMGPRAAAVIAEGRAATQMPGFGAKLDKDEIAALAVLYLDAAAADTCRGAPRRLPQVASFTLRHRRSIGRASRPIR